MDCQIFEHKSRDNTCLYVVQTPFILQIQICMWSLPSAPLRPLSNTVLPHHDLHLITSWKDFSLRKSIFILSKLLCYQEVPEGVYPGQLAVPGHLDHGVPGLPGVSGEHHLHIWAVGEAVCKQETWSTGGYREPSTWHVAGIKCFLCTQSPKTTQTLELKGVAEECVDETNLY